MKYRRESWEQTQLIVAHSKLFMLLTLYKYICLIQHICQFLEEEEEEEDDKEEEEEEANLYLAHSTRDEILNV